jgi:hypothetical protein
MLEMALADGTFSEIRPLRPADPNWEPIVVEGKPLSEIIIEERR